MPHPHGRAPNTPKPDQGLPAPSAEASAHSARLAGLIRAEIGTVGGALSFARYMELALYAPGLGYYRAGSRKFGPEGDFVTAPEVSPLFARCLARQCQQVLAALGGGDILEFGAGSGALAVELLGELQRLNALPAHYYILDLSGELRERQRQTLYERVPALAARVVWLDALPATPLTGVVLANELLDALPVHLFRLDAETVQERCVTWRDGAFAWAEQPAPPVLAQAVNALRTELPEPLPSGYCSEISLALAPWLNALAAALERGATLLIDYGCPRREYYLPERRSGTLQCHYRHRAHPDPLILPGLQDITAHVDFTAVAAAAQTAGLDVAGYTTQAHFLMANGLLEFAAPADISDTRARLALAQQIKTLTLPGEMGERFKVLGLTRGMDITLQGFALRDLRDRL